MAGVRPTGSTRLTGSRPGSALDSLSLPPTSRVHQLTRRPGSRGWTRTLGQKPDQRVPGVESQACAQPLMKVLFKS